jgi:hypothetical protein
MWVPETARTTRDLLVRQRQVARHDPLVALRLIYQMFSNLLSWIVLRTRSDTAKDIEILVLRHQLAVLQRRTPRPRMSWTDRALIAALTRLLPVRRRLGLLITPATVLGWHRRLVARPLDHPTDPTRSTRHQRQPPATPHARPGRSPTTTPPANDERHEHRPTARPARWAAPRVPAGRVTCAALLAPTRGRSVEASREQWMLCHRLPRPSPPNSPTAGTASSQRSG